MRLDLQLINPSDFSHCFDTTKIQYIHDQLLTLKGGYQEQINDAIALEMIEEANETKQKLSFVERNYDIIREILLEREKAIFHNSPAGNFCLN